MTAQFLARECIDRHVDKLSRPELSQLRFLEISNDIKLRDRNDGNELRPGPHILSFARPADTHNAIHRCCDTGAIQVDLREPQCSLLIGQFSLCPVGLACQNVQLLTLGCYFGLFFCNLRFDAFDVGNRGFQLLRCRPAVFRQRCLSVIFTDDALAVGVERRQSSFCLLDHTLLQGDVALCVADCGLCGGYAALA